MGCHFQVLLDLKSRGLQQALGLEPDSKCRFEVPKWKDKTTCDRVSLNGSCENQNESGYARLNIQLQRNRPWHL